jgi:hypothetical protein
MIRSLTPLEVKKDTKNIMNDYYSCIKSRNPLFLKQKVFLPLYSIYDDVLQLYENIYHLFSAHQKALNISSEQKFWDEYFRFVKTCYFSHECFEKYDNVSIEEYPVAFGRPDVIVSDKGPKVLETNFDTGIAGYDIVSDMVEVYKRITKTDTVCIDIFKELSQFFESQVNNDSSVYWITSPSHGRQIICNHIINELNKHSDSIVHIPKHPGKELSTNIAKSHSYIHRACSVYTFNTDLTRMSEDVRKFSDDLNSNITIPHKYGLFSSKSFLGYLSEQIEHCTQFSKYEEQAVKSLVPWTRVVTRISDNELKYILENPKKYVLKKCESYRGNDVIIGLITDQEKWRDYIDKAIHETKNYKQYGSIWIIQEYVKTKSIDVYEVVNGGFYKKKASSVCVGPFLFGNQIGGMLSWLTIDNHSNIMVGHVIKK